MRQLSIISLVVVAGLAMAAEESVAHACGGCFIPPGIPTQVSAHRMAFAISSHRTVLWDQIQYSGNPSEFGWVLPIRNAVDVGVSSDILFQRLEQYTQASVSAPPPPACPAPTRVCSCGFGASSSGGFASPVSDSGTVTVLSTVIVGPYEATQLSASDATALGGWLNQHGYVLPPAIQPLVAQYIHEGFGFLAVKLVPGAGTDRMVPIRIGFPGSSPTLPLRMVAAGTGREVGIKLFVFGEGRWEAQNFANAEIATKDLVWDWRTMSSNLSQLELAALGTSGGKTFVTESSDDYAVGLLASGLTPGTTEVDGGTTISNITDETELQSAFPGRSTVTVTRLFGQLPQAALASDLNLQASVGGKIPASRQAPVGINYACPQYDYYCGATCDGTDPGADGGGSVPSSGQTSGGPNAPDAASSTPYTPSVAPTSGGSGASGRYSCAASSSTTPLSSTPVAWAWGAALAVCIGLLGWGRRARRSTARPGSQG